MKRIFLALFAALAVLVAGTLPASAVQQPVTWWRFWSPEICMKIGDTSLNAGSIAAEWNQRSGGVLKIVSANNCVTAGYPPSRRFTISTISNANMPCAYVANIDGYQLLPNRDGNNMGGANEGTYLYSNNPRAYVNYHSHCSGVYPAYVQHMTSAAVGGILGLAQTNSSGYNSRVMNMTTYSIENVYRPDKNSGALLNRMYSGGCNASPDC